MTNPPVAPVVTDEMVEAGLEKWFESEIADLKADSDIWAIYQRDMRAAITAALEASGELERLRTALKPFADFDFAGFGGVDVLEVSLPGSSNPSDRIEPIPAKAFLDARTALQGDARDEIQEMCDLVDQSQPSQNELSQGRVISRFKW